MSSYNICSGCGAIIFSNKCKYCGMPYIFDATKEFDMEKSKKKRTVQKILARTVFKTRAIFKI